MSYDYKDSELYRNYNQQKEITVEELHEMVLNMKFEERDLYDNSISTDKIQDFAVDSAKIAHAAIGSAHIQDASIDMAKIKDLVVGEAEISDASITSAKIQDAAILTAHIAEAVIDRTKIIDGEITNAKIANGAIDNAKIGDLVVDSAMIEDAAITRAKIEDAAIGSTQIAEGSITDAHIVSLVAGKITSGTIDTGQVTVAGEDGNLMIKNNRLQVFDNQEVPVERVSLGDVDDNGLLYGFRVRGADGETVLYDESGVYNEGITDGAITNPKIGDGEIDNKHIVADTITGDKLVADAITAREIKSKSITANEIDVSTLTVGEANIIEGSIGTAHIADAAITNAKISNIDAEKITTGILAAERVRIGKESFFDEGFDPSTKASPSDVEAARTYAETKASEAQAAAEAVAQAKAELAEEQAKAHADGEVSKEQERAIADAEAKLEEAKLDAKTKADAAESAAKGYADTKASGALQEAKEYRDLWAYTGTTQIDGGNLYTNSVVANAIAANAIEAEHISSKAIKTDHLDVDTLSAISADLGEVTAGKLNAVEVEGIHGTFKNVTVNEGDITFADDTTHSEYSIISKRNLIKDHSFEMVKPDWDSEDEDVHRFNKFKIRKPGTNEFTYWRTSGTPYVAIAVDRSNAPNSFPMFGQQAAVVRSGDFIRQGLAEGIGGGMTLTFSAYFKRQWNHTPGRPRIEIDYIQYHIDGTSTRTRLLSDEFPTVPSDYTPVRYSSTFTVPSSFGPEDGLDLKLSGEEGSPNYVQVDGVQLVEGDKPTVYDDEDGVHSIITGQYEPSFRGSPLWTGALYLLDSHTVEPNKSIMDCMNGWVLQWSAYNIGSGPSNAQFQYTYLPKYAMYAGASNGHRALLSPSSSVSSTVYKYFYVNEDNIVGHSKNGDGDFRNMCLRAVYEY